jgi:hypothetical protein
LLETATDEERHRVRRLIDDVADSGGCDAVVAAGAVVGCAGAAVGAGALVGAAGLPHAARINANAVARIANNAILFISFSSCKYAGVSAHLAFTKCTVATIQVAGFDSYAVNALLLLSPPLNSRGWMFCALRYQVYFLCVSPISWGTTSLSGSQKQKFQLVPYGNSGMFS